MIANGNTICWKQGNERVDMAINNYNEYLSKWIRGLKDEINFWLHYMQNKGGLSFYGFYETIMPDRKFTLEKDIPMDMYGQKYKFIDVGSGPFSRCGVKTDVVELDAVSVDPLAYAYNELKQKYNIDNGIKLENGFVELLDKKYAANTFDMVHMSNSLDHCFSAIDGIYQLINICKVGGKIILRHAENEAERADYQGLHQWNLSLHNKENSFIIWRQNDRYDVCKLFEDVADFELVPDVKEENGHWKYNKVIITKRKEVILQENKYYEIMLNEFYKALIHELVNSEQIAEMAHEKTKSTAEIRINRIKNIWENRVKAIKILEQNHFNSIIIYGMGYVGNNLDYLLSACGKSCIKLDQKGGESKCFEAITLQQCENFNVDLIVSTVNDPMVMKELSCRKGENTILMNVDSFLNIME